MKRSCSFLVVSLFTALVFSSCQKDDTKWKNDNYDFIDQIKNREGIHEIGDAKNGFTQIYYEVLVEGTGEKPIIGNTVKVNYSGWLYNDTINYTPKHPLITNEVFDSIDKFSFKVGDSGVIPGWNLAIQQMPVGATWRIYIPENFAYGSSVHGSVPAYSTLIFDIRLLEITKKN